MLAFVEMMNSKTLTHLCHPAVAGSQKRFPFRAASLTGLLRRVMFALLGAGVISGWAASPRPMGTVLDTKSELRDWIEARTTDEEAIRRSYPAIFSQEGPRRLREFYQEGLRQLDRWDYSRLDVAGRIDWLLASHRFRYELQELDREASLDQKMSRWIPFISPLVRLEEKRRNMAKIDPRAAAEAFTETARQIGDLRRRLESSDSNATNKLDRPDKVIAARLVQSMQRWSGELRAWWTFYSGYDPEMIWWVRQPYERCSEALEGYVSFFQKEVLKATDGEAPLVGSPIGREALIASLAQEFIAYTPEELMALAESELAWCRTEWKKAAKDLGFGEDWRKALDHVAQLHVKPGDQPALIHELALEAIRFVEERDLVTVPQLCKDTWRMEMMSAERQKVNPYFTGGEIISVSFPTDAMSHDDKLMSLRGNNIHFCRATVHHELIPGHHLQTFMAARHRTYREPFRTPFLVEGWALYWEMLLWDLDFARSAEDRVGMLFWRTHRCARILFSLKFHLGQMTPQQAIDFLVETVGHERRNATAEVRRSIAGGYSPLYQAAYMVGGLQIRALRNEWVGRRRMGEREFHDAILKENAIPIELIRASLAYEKLPKDFEAKWRFYGQ